MESKIEKMLNFLNDTLELKLTAMNNIWVGITTSMTTLKNDISNISTKVDNLEKKADVQMDIITFSNLMLSEQIEISNMEVKVLKEDIEAYKKSRIILISLYGYPL